MWGISIYADFRPMGYKIHPAVVVGLGNDLLFNSSVGHCAKRVTNLNGRFPEFVHYGNSSLEFKSGGDT